MIRLSSALAFLLLLFLSGCIGTDVIDDLGNVEPRLEIFGTSTQPLDTVKVGESLKYGYRYVNASNEVVQVAVKWESSEPNHVTIDSDGNAQALEKGAAVITANVNGLVAQRILVIEAVERIEVTQAIGVPVGMTTSVTANYFDNQGMSAPATFVWTSENPAIATVDAAGTVTGVSAGQTRLTASANGVSSQSIYVTSVNNANDLAIIDLGTGSRVISINEPINFSAQGSSALGNTLSGITYTWQSTPTSVLQVDNNGLGNALSIGYAEVVASANGIESPPLSVLVVPNVVTSRTGSFTGVSNYSVSGDVTMERNSTGDLVLKFSESFSSSSGPGLYIYLSNSTTGGVSVGKLPQLSGAFEVTLPENTGIKDFNYVLIWCEPFGATFGHALLN